MRNFENLEEIYFVDYFYIDDGFDSATLPILSRLRSQTLLQWENIFDRSFRNESFDYYGLKAQHSLFTALARGATCPRKLSINIELPGWEVALRDNMLSSFVALHPALSNLVTLSLDVEI